MTTIDFNRALQDAKGASFEALPIGDYDVEVAKTESVTSSSGKPMVKATFKVVSGPYEKRSVLTQFVLSVESPMAMAIFFRHMKAFGLTEDWFAQLGQVSNLEPIASALLTRRARVTLGHREWQGETRNEVKAIKPYTGAPPAPTPGAPVGGPTAPGATSLPPMPTSPQVQPMPQPPVQAVMTDPTPTPTPTSPTVASSTAVAEPTTPPPTLPY